MGPNLPRGITVLVGSQYIKFGCQYISPIDVSYNMAAMLVSTVGSVRLWNWDPEAGWYFKSQSLEHLFIIKSYNVVSPPFYDKKL